MKETVISVNELCKTYYSDGEGNNVIKNVKLDINKGEFTVIMGSSGSGKSTLLYLLSGLESKTSGSVKVLNNEISEMKGKKLANFRREKIGFVYQNINLIQSLALIENVVLPAYLLNRNKKKADLRAKELLKSFGLESEMKKLPTKVSGGQNQRCAIARALINDPDIIFADEPTGALNSKAGKEVLDMLSQLSDTGKTIVMVTHDTKAAVRADRVVFIKDGRIGGELYLNKYNETETEYREKEVFSYLSGMGW
jgi:putative ABC transport system ATP-binding protein